MPGENRAFVFNEPSSGKELVGQRKIFSPKGVSPALTAGGEGAPGGGQHVYVSTIDTTGHQGDRVVMPDGVWPTLSAESCNNGGGANASAFAPSAFQWNVSESNRMSIFENKTPTLKSNAPPAVFQGTIRRLTPVECERLQGFPDEWTAVYQQSDGVRYKQIGNAVAVPVAEWVARRIVQAVAKRNQIEASA